MKRILATVLAIILCLGLCACSGVKQEVYDAAKAGYEEVSAKYDELKSKMEKYSTVIEALEKEDYDGAVEAVNAMRPVPETPPTIEVKITKENFFDYFEFACVPKWENAEKDSQGNYTNVAFDVKYVLKDGLAIAKEKSDECKVDAGVTFNLIWYPSNLTKTIDFETLEYEVNGSPFITSEDAMFKGKCKEESGKTLFEIPFYSGSIGSYCIGYINIQVYEDIELVSASGTLYLYE